MTKCTASQRKNLYRLFRYNKDTEAIHIKALTSGKHSTAGHLSILQANTLISNLQRNWAIYNPSLKQHKYIYSLLMQMGWSKPNEKHGTVADLPRLSNFLKSNKSPVPKPLQDMESKELSKLIYCLEQMLEKSL